MRDLVEYTEPLGALGWVAHALFVERALDRIFDFRRDAILRRFGPEAPIDPISSPLDSGEAAGQPLPGGGP
jgi:hypothetical protein